jgi:hypothetical protein
MLVAVSVALLAACSSGGATSTASRSPSPTTTTTVATTTTTFAPLPTEPTTEPISTDALVQGDVAVDLNARDFGLTLGDDTRQCAVESWVNHATPAERDALDLNQPNSIRDTNSDESHLHVAAAFGACLSAADLFTATVTSLKINGSATSATCQATKLQQDHLAPVPYWMLLVMGFAKAPVVAQTAVRAAQRAC